jgi:hypothetical protein
LPKNGAYYIIKEASTMSRDFSITLDGGFELGDADAFATVARRILGEKKYDEIRRQVIALPKGSGERQDG